jgi:hypothetical protein
MLGVPSGEAGGAPGWGAGMAHSYPGWLKATFSDNYLKIMLLKIKLL